MIDELIRATENAFQNVPFPGAERLTDSTYGEEPEALKREFHDKRDWRSLDAEFLDQAPEGWSSALSFFSFPALQFYLPAYLIADLRAELANADPVSRLCISLTPLGGAQKIAKVWGGGTMGSISREGFSIFSIDQVRVITKYLQWRLESSGGSDIVIQQALDNYWFKRCDSTAAESVTEAVAIEDSESSSD